MGKILIILSIVVSLASAGVGYVNRTTLLQTKESLASTQADLEKTKSNLRKQRKIDGLGSGKDRPDCEARAD